MQRKTQADEVELMTLRKATQLQKDGLYNMELKLQHSLEDGSRMKYELDAATAEVIKDCDRKIVEREAELEKEQKAIKVELIKASLIFSLKFVFFEKATKFDEISILLLTNKFVFCFPLQF